MSEWVLIVAFTAVVNFQDGSVVRENSTVESRPFETESACQQAGVKWEVMKRASNARQAMGFRAKIVDEKYSFHCIDGSEAM